MRTLQEQPRGESHGGHWFRGQAMSCQLNDGTIELALYREPCNELGSLALDELEKFAAALESTQPEAHALIIYSELKCGFSAGGGLRGLYPPSQSIAEAGARCGLRDFLEAILTGMRKIHATTRR